MKRRFNILQIIETGGPGGAETVLLNIVKNLDHKQFNPLVILLKKGWFYERLLKNQIETKVINSKRSWDIAFLIRLIRSCQQLKIDLIHSHLPGTNLYSCLAGFTVGIPIVTTYHGRVIRSQKTINPKNLKYFLIGRLSTKIVAVSDYLKNDLVQIAQFPPRKIKRIYNGVDWKRFDLPFDSVIKKKQLKIDLNEKVVGMVANLRPAKGYQYFIRAAAIIAKNIPKVKFLIIGEEEDKLRERITKEIKALGMTEKVILLGFREDVPELLRILDVFVLSSISEGLSIATIEAMAAGVPAVVTKSGGPEEVVVEGKTGFLVPPKDEKNLAEKALLLLKNKELATSMGKEAQVQVRTKLSIDMMIRNYQTVYQECLDKGERQI